MAGLVRQQGSAHDDSVRGAMQSMERKEHAYRTQSRSEAEVPYIWHVWRAGQVEISKLILCGKVHKLRMNGCKRGGGGLRTSARNQSETVHTHW